MNKLAVAVVVLLSAAGCGNPFEASVQAQSVCLRQLGQALKGVGAAGAPALPGTLSGSIHDEFPVDAGDLEELTKHDVVAKLGLQSFKITAPGVLAGVQQMHVVLLPPAGSGQPPITVIDYPAAAQAGLVRVEGDQITGELSSLGQDLVSYLAAGTVRVQVDAAGDLPASAWKADVELCASASAKYDYLK